MCPASMAANLGASISNPQIFFQRIRVANFIDLVMINSRLPALPFAPKIALSAMRRLAIPVLFFCFFAFSAQAQVALFTENFDNCTLPAGWQVNITGNQNPVWYINSGITNNNNTGQSMNGSCFLFVDDDATGDLTEAYIIDFVSPAFDASQNPTVELSVDVHYRDWGQAEESFEVLVTDGITETLIRRYDKHRSTGSNIYEYETLVFDLALVSRSPNLRLIFRYNDAGGYAWWAGVDNISVIGKGQGTVVLGEAFNSCEKPAGWETQVVTGNHDWVFGYITEGAALSGGNSMDGSCFVFFDDDFIGQNTPFSTIRLASPWFDGSQFGQFRLDFDLILRYHSEKIAVIVQHGDGTEHIVRESDGHVGGPYFSNYEKVNLDLSPYRAQQMRVIFEYDDGQSWAWWAGIDNVKITGLGAANDVCANAQPLLSGQACQSSSNANALLDGPLPNCVGKSVGGLWYSWTADFSGTAKLSTRATFNDVVNVFTGGCDTPQALICDNRDEHGFTGETSYFPVETGNNYLIRVSGLEGGFGVSRGTLCVGVEPVPAAPTSPANNACSNAFPLELDANCLPGSNLNANSSPTLPSFNELARHDLWYAFTAPSLAPNQVLQVRSNADFSDIITAFSGGCDALQEMATNHKGRALELNTLTAGETYWVQIAGTFATVEGSLCPQILLKNSNAPPNDNCQAAIPINVGGACTEGSNAGANTTLVPPCVVSVANDVWYRFTAPNSGAVRINTGAEFPHVLAVWKGNCSNLENLLCSSNPLRCDGYVLLGALSPGEIYFIQIASQIAAAGPNTGNFCLHLTDGSQAAPFEAISLQVEEKCVSTNLSQLQVNVQGGIPPYLFSGNPDGQLLAAGDEYLVVVTDALGCEKSLTGIMDDCEAAACAISGTLTSLQPRCHNAADGMLSAMVTGGVAPYSYQWSLNALNTAALFGIPAGTYTVTVMDAVGCDLVLNAELQNPDAITAVPTSIEQPTQGQSNGAIFLDIAGGTGQYGYVWRRIGAFFANTEDLTNAPAGTYTLQITDSNGCTALFEFTLTETVGNMDVSTGYFAEVFPNPAHDRAWLAVAFPQAQTLHLTLSDANGRTLRTWTERGVQEQNIPLDLRNLPAGTYRLIIRTEKETLVEQVVVAGKSK